MLKKIYEKFKSKEILQQQIELLLEQSKACPEDADRYGHAMAELHYRLINYSCLFWMIVSCILYLIVHSAILIIKFRRCHM